MGRGDSTLNALLCGKACACGSVSMVERGVIRQSKVERRVLVGNSYAYFCTLKTGYL